MSGYINCSCRDCFEVTVGEGPEEFCHGCTESGCPDYQGQKGMSQECQRADAYGAVGCPTCKKDDETYFDPGNPYNSGTWRCERCPDIPQTDGSNDDARPG